MLGVIVSLILFLNELKAHIQPWFFEQHDVFESSAANASLSGDSDVFPVSNSAFFKMDHPPVYQKQEVHENVEANGEQGGEVVQEGATKVHPNNFKVEAYNNSSEKIINSVPEVAVENAPPLESCVDNPKCEIKTNPGKGHPPKPSATPTPIPEPIASPAPPISIPSVIFEPPFKCPEPPYLPVKESGDHYDFAIICLD